MLISASTRRSINIEMPMAGGTFPPKIKNAHIKSRKFLPQKKYCHLAESPLEIYFQNVPLTRSCMTDSAHIAQSTYCVSTLECPCALT